MAGEMQQDSEDQAGFSSINVTPFVDVVLVLLVIFMITAPILVKESLNLNLPKVDSGDGPKLETLGVAINKDGNIFINGQIADLEVLKQEALKAVQKDSNAQAIIGADKDVNYGRVVEVIDVLKTNGLQKFAVQIEKKNE